MATLKSTTVADGTIELPDHSSAPSPTANKLYANTTSLYWEDGDLVSGGGGGAADKQTTGNAISNSAASDTGPSQGYRMHPGSSTTIGITARANTFMHGTFYNELVVMGDVEAPGVYIRGEGTDNSQVFTEQGPIGHTITAGGHVKYENTVSLPWATTSIYFDGTTDYLSMPHHEDFALRSADFTIEFWIYPTSVSADFTVCGSWASGGDEWRIWYDVSEAKFQILFYDASAGADTLNINSGATGTVLNTWTHVAVTRTNGSQYIWYINGKQNGASVDGTPITMATWGTFRIGEREDGALDYTGYLAEFRLAKGMVRYTENFVPPQGYQSARMASFVIDATTFNSTESPATLDVGSRDRLGDDTLGDGHVQVTFKENYTINSTAYMIPIEFKNSTDHEWSLNTTIWPRAVSNTYMIAATDPATTPVFAASAYYGNRGIFFGGVSPIATIDTIEYYTSIGTSAEAVDFGNLTVGTATGGALSGGARAIYAGGEANPGDTVVDTIEYITVASTGEATDFGDLINVRAKIASNISDGSRGVMGCGAQPGSTPTRDNTMDYITISTTGNAKDFGEAEVGHMSPGGHSNGSRGIISGGLGGPNGTTYSNIISYITIGVKGNSIDFGDLHHGAAGPQGHGSVSDGSRGVIGGGGTPSNVDTIAYFNMAALGNSSDFGELTQARRGLNGGSSNGSRGLIAVGGNPAVDTIEYITIGVLGNAVDWNELGAAAREVSCTSGD
jgi:hypothetical protein